MSWSSSSRRASLPSNWNAIAAERQAFDHYRCQWPGDRGGICGRKSDGGVDHRVHRDNHELWALWSLCKFHHDRKTQQEARAARGPARTKWVPQERHPGLINED